MSGECRSGEIDATCVEFFPGRIPEGFEVARVLGVLPICPVTQDAALAFSRVGFGPMRLRIPLPDARFLLLVLGDYLRAHDERLKGGGQ